MPVLADQVPVDWAGDIYCAVIHECFRLGDLNRMKTWTDAMEKWCQGPDVSASWYGTTCEIHKYQLLSATNDYQELEERLVTALASIEDFHAPTAGEGHYELGDLRRRRGDVDGARAAFARARALGWDPQPGEALLRCQIGENEGPGTTYGCGWTPRTTPSAASGCCPRRSKSRLPATASTRRTGTAPNSRTAPRSSTHRASALGLGTPAERFWSARTVRPRRSRYSKTRCGATAPPNAAAELAQVYQWMAQAHRATGDTVSAAADTANAESIYQQLGARAAVRRPTSHPAG